MKWLRGYLTCYVKTGHWERFMNMCRHHNIKLWKVKKQEENTVFCMFAKDYRILCSFVGKTAVVPHICEKKGFPFIVHTAKRNWTFTIGLIVFFALMKTLSLFVWEIHFEGQREYTKETIRKEVDEMGVYPGMLRKNLNCDHIERSLRERYENMSWVSAEENGCVLNIKIKEGTAEKKVEEEDTTPCHLVAPCDGVIKSIVTKTGTPQVKNGQKVHKGDVLIKGFFEIKDDSGTTIRRQGTCADGDVTMIADKSFDQSINKAYIAKEKTGKVINVYKVRVNGKGLSIKNPVKWFDNSFNYDIISSVCVDEHYRLGNTSIKMVETKYIEYTNVAKQYSEKEARKKLENQFDSEQMTLEEEGCKILNRSFRVKQEQSAFHATGSISYLLTQMKKVNVTEEELILQENGKEDEDGSGTDNS